MSKIKNSLESNARILKSQVSKFALLGLAISLTAIIVATLAVGYQMTGNISFESIILAQSSNIALMTLDMTPILFMFWGQSISHVMSYKASAMIIDQTNELRMLTSGLESKVMHESRHDMLTDLPNRILFLDHLDQAISTLKNKKSRVGVFILNLNNFKDLNTGFGNYNADRLLNQFAQRLKNVVSESVILARLGGNEFAILMTDFKKEVDAHHFFQKIKDSIKLPFVLDGIEIDLIITAGLAFYPEHGKNSETLINRADIAAYHASQSVKDLLVYNAKLDPGNQNKLILLSELRKALDDKQVLVHFQPIVELATGKIKNCEALLYWDHPTFGMMSAEKFIPMTERTGLINVITAYVLDDAIKNASNWKKNGLDIVVSVNLSAVDIVNIEIPATIKKLLVHYDLPPDRLKIELIESAYLSDQHVAIEVIEQLSKLGVKIAIDDFGTGYSSLVYLATLPIHEVKIDKSFIINMHLDEKKRNIVKAIVQLAKALNLSVVGEGIENTNHIDFLKSHGCTFGQGFYFSKALDSDALQAFVGLG